MSNRLALPGLFVLLVVILALTLSGLVRELVVIPLLYLLWLMRVIFESIPQVILWVGFLALAAIVAWNSLAGPRAPPPARQPVQASRAPVAAWAALFERTTRDDYARQLLAQRLGQLAFELLASQGQPPAQSLWQYLNDMSQDIPPDVRAYFQAGVRMHRPLSRFWDRWWPRTARQESRSDPLDLDPEQVVRFLEERMLLETRD
ncbi:MAG: hypothetical protein ACJ8CR_13785 [Roseiflexaceae bacterium]